jgi:hypothetical protein
MVGRMVGESTTSLIGSGWVVEDARQRIPRRKAPSGAPIWGRWWDDNKLASSLFKVTTCVLALQVISFFAVFYHWALWSGFEPSHPATIQAVLWQVDAGLVAIALPIVFVVAQQSASMHNSSASLPIAEVLRQETDLLPMLSIAALGLARCGIDSIWFRSDVVLLIDFGIIFLPTLAMLLLVSSKLFSLSSDPKKLRDKAVEVLLWRLRDAVIESWVFSVGNETLQQRVGNSESLVIRYSPIEFTQDETDWQSIYPLTSAELSDVHAGRFVEAFEHLLSQSGQEFNVVADALTVSQPSGTLGGPFDSQSVDVYFYLKVGERLSISRPAFAVRRSLFHELDSEDAWREVQSAMKLGTDVE